MSRTRENILSKLRGQERAVKHPAAWRSRQQFPDLVARFTESLTAAKGELFYGPNLAEALTQVDMILKELQATRIVANLESPLSDLDLPARYPAIKWHLVGQSDSDLRSFCASADVGISSADAALAETGTLVISSGAQHSRLATLLPPVHLALVPTSRLTTDIFTWSAARQGQLAANVVLVSGPSKTGDIEMTLVMGVHGPKRFIVVLYEDEER